MTGIPRTKLPDTAFNKLIVQRLEELDINRADLVERLQRRGAPIDQAYLWRTMHRGKPLPFEWLPIVGAVLGWEEDSPMYRALVEANEALSTKRRPHSASYSSLLEMRLKAAEGRLKESERRLAEFSRRIEALIAERRPVASSQAPANGR